MLFQELKICNDDIDYFNKNCQNVEDLESLIFQLETKEAEIFTNSISIFHNKDNKNSSIDTNISQLEDISNATKILKSRKSPYSSLIQYTHENINVYKSYERLREAELELEQHKKNPELSINSALNYLIYILEQPNPFNNRNNIKYFTTETFCQSLSFIQQFLNDYKKNKIIIESNVKIEEINNVFQDCEDRIIKCPFSNFNPLFPLLSFYPYLLDPSNNHLFKKYFKVFTEEYCKYLLNKYLYSMNINQQNPTLPNFFQLIQPCLKKRHYNTIIALNKIIETEINENKFQLLEYQKQKIIDTIDSNLILIIVKEIKTTSLIDYTNFTGATFDELKQYEYNIISNIYIKKIEDLDENNFFQYFHSNMQKLNQLNLVHNLANTIKAKIDTIDKLLRRSNKSDRFIKLVELARCIDFFNSSYNFHYNSDLKNYLFKKAFEKGKADIQGIIQEKHLINSIRFFLEIKDESTDPNIEIYNKKYNEFKINFVLYHPNLEVTDYYLEYLYTYSHGFLTYFYDIWEDKINKIKEKISKLVDEQFTIETCCIKFIDILYYGLKLEPTNEDSIEKPIFDENRRFDLSALQSNANISSGCILNSKKLCYQKLLAIVNKIY